MRLNTPDSFHKDEEEDYLDYLNHHMEDYFVVELNGEIVAGGGINYFINHNEARISWDIIHPDHQGQGLGRLLMDHRLQQIRKMPGVEMVVVRTTQVACKFYEKMGFKLNRTVKDYWAPGFDLCEMSQPLFKFKAGQQHTQGY